MTVKKAELYATWDISLNCECPKCKEFVDLLRAQDFWCDHERLMPVENGTERSNNLEVSCPECNHEFEVCCEY
jgi:phage FluMu protein Com